ncbi:MAG: glycosyltransferase [Bacilli bacterium]|nr:glycosyltransferase [Bacilli bacterium]
MNKKVSIIVPVYNSAKYLYQCLNSIKNQTFSDFELILIDDGSNDESYDICKNFCLNEKRAILYHNENHGVSYSRNFGICHSNCEFICFVDSDDVVDKDFVEKMYSRIKGKDIVFCRFSMFSEFNLKTKYFENNLSNLVHSPSSLQYLLVGDKYSNKNNLIETNKVFGSCCRSMFRKNIIQKYNIKFPENVVLGEDTVFLMNYLLCCKNAYLVDEYLYFYRISCNSAVKKYATNYVSNFYETRIETLRAEIDSLSKIQNNNYACLLENYVKMDFNFNFVINEIKLNPLTSYNKLLKISKNEYKTNLNFKIKLISKLNKITFKRKILLILIKYRNYRLISFFLRRNKKWMI